jgi:RimJ/RimL family protein N-acetyltransferase
MHDGVVGRCAFVTERLRVDPWWEADARGGVDLAESVAELLTARTTEALPESWRGDYSVERARAWIAERDAESPTLLVTEVASARPVGLVVLAEVPLGESAIDVRVGFVIAEDAWGRGLASEVVAGLIDWARRQPTVRTLTGGVDPEHRASARVLEKCGFRRLLVGDDSTATYRFELEPGNEWDRYADGWDTDPATRAYASAAFASLGDVLRDRDIALDGARVIDFGCGTGLLTELLVAAGAAVEAVDTSPAMLDVVEAKIVANGWTGVTTGSRPVTGGAAADLVVCSSVCSFLDDYPAAVADLTGHLRAGGLFVQWDWERAGDEAGGLTRTEIRRALTGAGLVGVTVGPAFSIAVDDQIMAPLMGHGHRSPDPGADRGPV